MIERKAPLTAQGQFIIRVTPKQFAAMLKGLKNDIIGAEPGSVFEFVRTDEKCVQVHCHPTAGKERIPRECIATVEYIDDTKSLLTAVAQGVVGLFDIHLLRESNVALLEIFSKIAEYDWLDPETPFADHNVVPGIDFRVGASPQAIREIISEHVGSSGFDSEQEQLSDVCWTFFQCTDLEQIGGRYSFSVTARLGWEDRKYDLELDKPTYAADFRLLPLNDFETHGEVLFLYAMPKLEKVVRDAVTFLVSEVGGGKVQSGVIESTHLATPTDASKPPKWSRDQIAFGLLVAGFIGTLLACIAAWLVVPQVQEVIQFIVRGAIPTLTPTLVSPTATP
jgi:hypothetical protein